MVAQAFEASSKMTRLENPVFTYELRSRLRLRKLISAIFLRCACLFFIYFLVILAYLGKGILAFILAEAFLILFFTPGSACRSFASNARQRDLRDLVLTRLSASAILLGKFIVADFYTFVVIAISAIVMLAMAIFRADIGPWHLIRANAALLILGFSSTVVGLAFSMMFRRGSPVAYALTYMLIFLLIGSVIIPGPLMEHIQNSKIRAMMAKWALYANPIIMASRALGNIDLMRTEYMYMLADPIVNWGFTYPDWYFAGGIYLAVSCLLLIPVFFGFKRRIHLPEQIMDFPRTL